MTPEVVPYSLGQSANTMYPERAATCAWHLGSLMISSHQRLTHHFTASGLVIEQEHILLVNHKRIGAWVPPGGHIEVDELPDETVVREIQEETGLTVEIISTPSPKTGDPEAFFLHNPVYVQSVLAIEGGERFYHVDLAYLCRPVQASEKGSLPLLNSSPEVKESRWVRVSEVDKMPLAKNVREALDFLLANQTLMNALKR